MERNEEWVTNGFYIWNIKNRDGVVQNMEQGEIKLEDNWSVQPNWENCDNKVYIWDCFSEYCSVLIHYFCYLLHTVILLIILPKALKFWYCQETLATPTNFAHPSLLSLTLRQYIPILWFFPCTLSFSKLPLAFPNFIWYTSSAIWLQCCA